MFIGPDYAEVARPLVDLTRKDSRSHWTELHTQAVRMLKQRLIDYTTLQVPYTTKPSDPYTDASGYTIGRVLEQAEQPVGFLTQVINPSHQNCLIYNQNLLAFVTAVERWSRLLQVAKVTAHTDHQAVTHMQQVKASKPLRGRAARSLDFLAEVPDLTITYLQGGRNQVAEALSGLSCYPSSRLLPTGNGHATPHTGATRATYSSSRTRDLAHNTRGRPPNYRELHSFTDT
ncbi:hypothetical protein EBH_0086260 [Eimeria brunetti]|uniref:Reverse transcriptase/retrotransposon-derived protein RNase H-like domain-containing protein n=1 Tax=Eimeria brunetti TaxID=51314 RepID=U6LK33_9EIME|nr:hypothetical protein EBH_0086260 [Eimeria brunetti]